MSGNIETRVANDELFKLNYEFQDLKDHMKSAGEIIYSTVNRNNSREG